MLGCDDAECKDWREYAKRRLKCDTRDPVVLRDFRDREQEGVVEIVEKDKADIDDCDIVLVNFIRPSVGTSMEIQPGISHSPVAFHQPDDPFH